MCIGVIMPASVGNVEVPRGRSRSEPSARVVCQEGVMKGGVSVQGWVLRHWWWVHSPHTYCCAGADIRGEGKCRRVSQHWIRQTHVKAAS